ncbi:hypothetical protein E6C60_2706 [Paenibacillus algicola]|uniref:Gelsolin-like domain-containing protein n=1 Tax=Paenibacillus algicola TaxID=2565926 RepID=A0A4P8XLP4_9BACL|nr:hypothetical protein E6C60_2706 [Paenibacillus algicola]
MTVFSVQLLDAYIYKTGNRDLYIWLGVDTTSEDEGIRHQTT